MPQKYFRLVFWIVVAATLIGCDSSKPPQGLPAATNGTAESTSLPISVANEGPMSNAEVTAPNNERSQSTTPPVSDDLNDTSNSAAPTLTPFDGGERPEWALIEAVRRSPWDESAIIALADWYADRDPARSELVRLDMQVSQMEWKDPERPAKQSRLNQLLAENRERWIEPAKGLAANVEIRAGLIDQIECEETTDEQIAQLARIPEVRELRLTSPKLSLKGFGMIARLPHLDAISIDGLKLTDRHWAILESLPPWTSIRLWSDDLDRDAATRMNERRIAKFDKLTAEQQYSGGVRFLSTFDSGITFGRRLTAANLSQAGVTDLEMRLVAPLTDLTSFYISESDVTQKGIAQLSKMHDLKYLGMFSTKVASLESLAGLTNLETLDVFPDYDTKMDDAGLAVIEKFTKLTSLEIHESGIGDATVRRLAGLTKLQTLKITLNKLDDSECLSALSGLTELRLLELHGPKTPDSALKYLAPLKQLEQLSINVSRGTGDGMRHIAGLDQLRLLFLMGEGVTDRGIQHLSTLPRLKVIMGQSSAITTKGAKQLADKLTGLTIILDNSVVTSPRASYTMTRHRLKSATSVLLPQDWFEKSAHDDSTLAAKEDGWKQIGGWSGSDVGPTEIQMYLDTESKSPQEAMTASVENNAHLNPRILERDKVKTELKDVASCVYQNDQERHLLLVAKTPDGMVVLDCSAKPKRFGEFRGLFEAVAASLRVDPNADVHADETVELPVTK